MSKLLFLTALASLLAAFADAAHKHDHERFLEVRAGRIPLEGGPSVFQACQQALVMRHFERVILDYLFVPGSVPPKVDIPIRFWGPYRGTKRLLVVIDAHGTEKADSVRIKGASIRNYGFVSDGFNPAECDRRVEAMAADPHSWKRHVERVRGILQMAIGRSPGFIDVTIHQAPRGTRKPFYLESVFRHQDDIKTVEMIFRDFMGVRVVFRGEKNHSREPRRRHNRLNPGLH